VSEIVQYYYLWKTTPSYEAFRRSCRGLPSRHRTNAHKSMVPEEDEASTDDSGRCCRLALHLEELENGLRLVKTIFVS